MIWFPGSKDGLIRYDLDMMQLCLLPFLFLLNY